MNPEANFQNIEGHDFIKSHGQYEMKWQCNSAFLTPNYPKSGKYLYKSDKLRGNLPFYNKNLSFFVTV